VRFRVRDAGRVLQEIGALLESSRAELVELKVRKATLEDVFIALTGRPPENPEQAAAS
jgi:outer membrane protein TolC